MKFKIDHIDKSEIEQSSTFPSSYKYLNEIELNYKYIGEPNNDRIQLEVELIINNKNIIPDLGIDKTVFLPNQYPGAFELVNKEKNILSIPHEGGIYLLELGTLNIKFIEYLRSKRNDTDFMYYKESYFYLDYFILVGIDNFLIYNIFTFDKLIVELNLENQEEIESLKIIKSEIIISVSNYSNGDNKYFLISKFDGVHKNSFKKYLLSEYIGVNNNDSKTFELYISKDNDVKVTPIQLDLLQSKSEIIDWLDWTYSFTKQGEIYKLWVYLGGIAEQVREIKLSDLQVKEWQEKGNEYIKQLSADLQQKESKIYLDAINENRKIL